MSDRRSIGDGETVALPGGADRRVELVPGERLGRYEILRLLGRGGMGQVYLVRHELQKSLHALKILPAAFSGRPGFLERFRTELRTMANMQHPNIVHVQYSDEEGGRHYLVMDFVAADNGEEPYDLEEALAVETRFSPDTVRRLALQLCEGLAYAHGRGVVHRDLKPANVLLTSKTLSQADVRICDFGLAKVVGESEVRTQMAASMQRSLSMGDRNTYVEKRRDERSSDGVVLGTYGYMSPEQEEGQTADERSDIYALGVMFYRMLTGQRLRGMAKPASRIVRGLSPVWDGVISRCLEADPAARWQTVKELSQALSRIGTSPVQGARKPAGPAVPAGFLPALLHVLASVGKFLLQRTLPAARSGFVNVARAVTFMGRKRVAWLVGLVLAVMLSMWSYRAYRTHCAKVKAKEDADAYGEFRKKLDEQEFAKVYPEAVKVWEQLQTVSRDMPFGPGNMFKEYWSRIEWAREQKRWTEALQGCQQLIAMSSRYIKSPPLGTTGPVSGGGTIKPVPGGDADTAAVTVRAIQNYRKLKAEFDLALAAEAALLANYGGAKWEEVRREQKKGEGATRDPIEGVRAYAAALMALPGAVEEAKKVQDVALRKIEEEQLAEAARRDAELRDKKAQEQREEEARLAKEKADAEQARLVTERRAAEQRAMREKARKVEMAAALAEALKAKGSGEWQEVLRQTAQVLRLENERLAAEPAQSRGPVPAEIAEAQALQVEAEQALLPKYTLIAEAGGSEVEAEISDGENRYQAPYTFVLKPGGNYSLKVSMDMNVPGKSARYKPVTVQIVADWQGARTNRVALEKMDLPDEGRPWVSPATGMEFVWVPAIKGWVGKYEVTNGEYRKMDANHDSGSYKGQNLNGDRQPVGGVNFYTAISYAAWLTERDRDKVGGLRYRIPTEAEWLVFAQCGDGREYPWGNAMPPQFGNYSDSASVWMYKIRGFSDGFAVSCPVEQSGGNPWGLFGVGGNVWECCASDADRSAFGAWRGSSWNGHMPDFMRCAYRDSTFTQSKADAYGFRLVLSR